MFQDNDSNHPDPNASVGYASGDKIAAFISYLSTMLATLLLVGAILVLYKVSNNDLRLGLIALFTVVFAASVGLLTNASMAEVFGATAASVIPSGNQTVVYLNGDAERSGLGGMLLTDDSYAAVLVVFVSGNLTSD